MNNPATPSIERRFTFGKVEIRADEKNEKQMKVRGYAALFDRRSENLGTDDFQFYETIIPGAFDDVLNDDVRALFNHEPNLILARSKNGAGTLSIGVDSSGLWYEFNSPDTQAGRDLITSLQRGDIDQSSFAFSLKADGQEWKTERDGKGPVIYNRTIKKIARLYDVSPVTYPAYNDTTVDARSLMKISQPQITKTAERDLWAARLGITTTTPAKGEK